MIYGTPFDVVVYRSYKLLKMAQFFGPPGILVTIRKLADFSSILVPCLCLLIFVWRPVVGVAYN